MLATLSIIGVNTLGCMAGYRPELDPFCSIIDFKPQYMEQIDIPKNYGEENHETLSILIPNNVCQYNNFFNLSYVNITEISEIFSTILKFQGLYGIGTTLDYIYSTFEVMLFSKEFEICNYFFAIADEEKLDDESLLGLLSITSAWKNQLALRIDFFNKVQKKLSIRYSAKEVSELLLGLE
ncbi:hypothetical protein [Labilibaculum euxinus]